MDQSGLKNLILLHKRGSLSRSVGGSVSSI